MFNQRFKRYRDSCLFVFGLQVGWCWRLIDSIWFSSLLLMIRLFFCPFFRLFGCCFRTLPKNEMKMKKKRVAVRPARWAPWKVKGAVPLKKSCTFWQRTKISTGKRLSLTRKWPVWCVPQPIVLIGPPGVGRNELKRRLIALDPNKFRTTIPCEKMTKTFRCRKIVASTLWLNFCLTFVTYRLIYRYFAVAKTGRSGRSRLSFPRPAADGAQHRRRTLYRIRRVQGQFVRDGQSEYQGNYRIGLHLHPQSSLSGPFF